MGQQIKCPSCGSAELDPFYQVGAVPTNSCILIESREEALSFPTGEITLCFCSDCGFIFNGAWESSRTVYKAGYEETQAFSPTFNLFNRQLAADLIDRHGLHGRDILEIGCGKGEFLSLLCEIGPNRGVGYDPGFDPERLDPAAADRMRIVRDFYDERTAGDEPADLVCCKMTLEHIHGVADFIGTVRGGLHPDRNPLVFFQVPETGRILDDLAFWDVYYEHVSYFTPVSLAGLFRRKGFTVERVWTGYADQYLMIEARPDAGVGAARRQDDREEIAALSARVKRFATAVQTAQSAWLERIRGFSRRGLNVVLWGSGSKAVSFMTTLGLGLDDISHVVDVNPHRHGRYLPQTGQLIVAPADLARLKPDAVVVMNPIYREEIMADLAAIGCQTEVMTV